MLCNKVSKMQPNFTHIVMLLIEFVQNNNSLYQNDNGFHLCQSSKRIDLQCAAEAA